MLSAWDSTGMITVTRGCCKDLDFDSYVFCEGFDGDSTLITVTRGCCKDLDFDSYGWGEGIKFFEWDGGLSKFKPTTSGGDDITNVIKWH